MQCTEAQFPYCLETDPKPDAQTQHYMLSPFITPPRAQEYSTHLPGGAGGRESSGGRGPPCVYPDSAPPEEPGQTDAGRRQAD